MRKINISSVFGLLLLITIYSSIAAGCLQAQQNDEPWITFTPEQSVSNGLHVVLISGDEEYRSEEALPMLAKILTTHHGFKTTVLFSTDPETGEINPDNQNHIVGMENLQSADLAIIFLRFRELPDSEMRYFDEFLKAGKPLIGLRTSTHAFAYQKNPESPYAKYSWNNNEPGWQGGFGRQILGETWVDHHGDHGTEGTRGLVDGIMERMNHPVIRGVSDIWGPTDVYGTRVLEGDPEVLLWGQSTAGMTPDAPVNWEKSIMPVAWTKSYQVEGGSEGQVFATTMGSSVDFESEDLRRLIVNATYWLLRKGSEIDGTESVEIVGDYEPTMFGFGDYVKGKYPSDYK